MFGGVIFVCLFKRKIQMKLSTDVDEIFTKC